MLLGKVIGTVVATRKVDSLVGGKLLVVRYLELDGKPNSAFDVCLDTVGAGAGETVLVVKGSSARMVESFKNSPTDASIIAIVDNVEVKGS